MKPAALWWLGSIALLALAAAACSDQPVGDNSTGKAPSLDIYNATQLIEADPDTRIAELASKPLFRALLQQNLNGVISPHGILTVLSMLERGSDGETSIQMQRVIGSWRFDTPQHGVFSNALWVRPGLELAADYASVIRLEYGATPGTLDQDTPADTVNNWVSRSTQGKITQLVDPVGFDPELVAVNAMTFSERWRQPFENPQDHLFLTTTGQSVQMTFVSTRAALKYIDHSEYQAVQIPYDSAGVSLSLVVPKSDGLSPHLWPNFANTARREVTVALPEFEASSRMSLRKALLAAGMRVPFQAGDAKFSTITADAAALSLDDIVHQAIVTVDREGTEAAAATAAVMFGSLPPVEMVADRPFWFSIQSGSVLLVLGRFTGESG